MILPISIDLQDVVEEFQLNESQSQSLGASIIDRVIQEYSVRWEGLVNSELKQSKNEYKRAMFIQRTSATDVVFGLSARESKLAMMIEEGATPFDEKIGFEKSSKVKQKVGGGWYLTIPFRHATSGAIAESGIFASVMNKAVYDIAKKSSQPLKRNQLPTDQQRVGSRKEINLPGIKVPEYIHKTAPYEGLVKINIASTDKEKRSGYYTFRRVSDKSDPSSWWNGGLEARKLMNKALTISNISRVAEMAIDDFLSKL